MTGRTLPICLANLIVFFVVGVWHGAAWKYIVYGMYNGIIIAFSGLMAEHYRNWKKEIQHHWKRELVSCIYDHPYFYPCKYQLVF